MIHFESLSVRWGVPALQPSGLQCSSTNPPLKGCLTLSDTEMGVLSGPAFTFESPSRLSFAEKSPSKTVRYLLQIEHNVSISYRRNPPQKILQRFASLNSTAAACRSSDPFFFFLTVRILAICVMLWGLCGVVLSFLSSFSSLVIACVAIGIFQV